MHRQHNSIRSNPFIQFLRILSKMRPGVAAVNLVAVVDHVVTCIVGSKQLILQGLDIVLDVLVVPIDIRHVSNQNLCAV